MSMSAALRASKRAPFLQVAKSAVATTAAWLIAGWLVAGPPPVFAAIAALLVVQPSVNQSLVKGIERSIGVIVGVVIAALLELALGSGTLAILLTIITALLLAWLLRMTAGTGNQVAISAMLVLTLGTTTSGYAVDRVLETLIGAAVGFVVSLAVVPPVAIAPAQQAIDAVGAELADAMERLADAATPLRTPAELEELLGRARALRPPLADADAAIRAAEESLTLNPRARRYRPRVAELHASLDRFSSIATQLIGMTRAYADRYDSALAGEPTMIAIADQLRRAAHDVRLVSRVAVEGGAPAEADDPPALTRPLRVTAPTSDHWILLGSLLVDLERIHATLSEAAAAAAARPDPGH